MRTTWAALRLKTAQTLWQHRPSFPCNFAHVQIAPRRLPVKTPPRSGASLPGSPPTTSICLLRIPPGRAVPTTSDFSRPLPSSSCGSCLEELFGRPALRCVSDRKRLPTVSDCARMRLLSPWGFNPRSSSAFSEFSFSLNCFFEGLPDNEPCFPRIFSCVQSFLFEGFAGSAPGLSQNFPCGSAASCRSRGKPRSSASGKRFHGPCLTSGGGHYNSINP